MKPLWKILLALVVVLIAGTAVFIASSKPAPIQYPSPNGYDDILKAGQSLVVWQDKSVDSEDMTGEDRRWLLLTNSASLELVRAALEKTCHVVAPANLSSPQVPNYLDGLRNLSRLILLEAEAAKADGDGKRLLSACIEHYKFGIESSRGGRAIEGSVGASIRSKALVSFSLILSSGDPALCRKAALGLFAARSKVPPVEEYLEMSNRWKKALPLLQRLKNRKALAMSSDAEEGFRLRLEKVQQHESETLRDLAAAAFELEHGRAATNWTELVPEYLPEIPRNVTNNTPLALPKPQG